VYPALIVPFSTKYSVGLPLSMWNTTSRCACDEVIVYGAALLPWLEASSNTWKVLQVTPSSCERKTMPAWWSAVVPPSAYGPPSPCPETKRSPVHGSWYSSVRSNPPTPKLPPSPGCGHPYFPPSTTAESMMECSDQLAPSSADRKRNTALRARPVATPLMVMVVVSNQAGRGERSLQT
jgi:hypothetical protein